MTTKLLGAEWKAFFAEPWPDGWYYEDEIITVNGEEVDTYEFDPSTVADDAKMTLDGGIIRGDSQTRCTPPMTREGIDLEKYFKRWRDRQFWTTCTVGLPKDKVKQKAIKDAIKAAGGKIL